MKRLRREVQGDDEGDRPGRGRAAADAHLRPGGGGRPAVEAFAEARAGEAGAAAKVRALIRDRDWVSWVRGHRPDGDVPTGARRAAGDDPVWVAGLTEKATSPVGRCAPAEPDGPRQLLARRVVNGWVGRPRPGTGADSPATGRTSEQRNAFDRASPGRRSGIAEAVREPGPVRRAAQTPRLISLADVRGVPHPPAAFTQTAARPRYGYRRRATTGGRGNDGRPAGRRDRSSWMGSAASAGSGAARLRTEDANHDWAAGTSGSTAHATRPGVGAAAVSALLTHLDVERMITASNQTRRCNTLLFLYRHVREANQEHSSGHRRPDGMRPGRSDPGATTILRSQDFVHPLSVLKKSE